MLQSAVTSFAKGVLRRIFYPNGKFLFLEKNIPKQSRLLDVGCGNNSPQIIKQFRPDLYYIGIDVGIYRQSGDVNFFADEFVLTSPENFHLEIEKRKNTCHAVISSHNLEHCNEPDKVLLAMIQALQKDGFLYLSFPSEASIHFPTRSGTLNFYDDETHKTVPSFEKVLSTLKSNGMKIIKLRKRNRSILTFIIGLCFEPYGHLMNKQAPMGGTWALYGFETIIIAQKNN
jgi:SAM-dependent methyltransferase